MFESDDENGLTIHNTVTRAELSVYPRALIEVDCHEFIIPSDAARVDIEVVKDGEKRVEVRRLDQKNALPIDVNEEPWVVDVRGVFREIRNSLFAALQEEKQRNFVQRGPNHFTPEFYSALDFEGGHSMVLL